MITKNNGGPAFPFAVSATDLVAVEFGMTLRDWFAGQAMKELISLWPVAGGKIGDREATAKAAYEFADAMLAERAKG